MASRRAYPPDRRYHSYAISFGGFSSFLSMISRFFSRYAPQRWIYGKQDTFVAVRKFYSDKIHNDYLFTLFKVTSVASIEGVSMLLTTNKSTLEVIILSLGFIPLFRPLPESGVRKRMCPAATKMSTRVSEI